MRKLVTVIAAATCMSGCKTPAFVKSCGIFQTATAREIFREVKEDIKAAEDGIEQACKGVQSSKNASNAAIAKAEEGAKAAIVAAQTKKDAAVAETQKKFDEMKSDAQALSKDLKTAMGDKPPTLLETITGTEKKSS